jgi:hypothetical protein
LFVGKGGEKLLKQLVKTHADDSDKVNKLRLIGKQLHPDILFFEYIPIVTQFKYFKPFGGPIRDKELYGEFDMNLLPPRAFLEESIANNVNYFSAKTAEWVHASYEDQNIKTAPHDVWLEITDKFR